MELLCTGLGACGKVIEVLLKPSTGLPLLFDNLCRASWRFFSICSGKQDITTVLTKYNLYQSVSQAVNRTELVFITKSDLCNLKHDNNTSSRLFTFFNINGNWYNKHTEYLKIQNKNQSPLEGFNKLSSSAVL